MTMYKKGVRKENYIADKLRNQEIPEFQDNDFDIVQRTAGSHSDVDILCINHKTKEILLVQCKRTLSENMDYIDPKLKEKIEKENNRLNGLYVVEFVVL